MEHGSAWLLTIIALTSFALSFIGATVGLVLGHLRLPLLIAYLGSPGAGAAMNLTVSGAGALAGVYRHFRDGFVSWTGLALMGIPSAVGAIIAVKIFVKINPLWSNLVIGFVLIVSGVSMIRKKPTTAPPGRISLMRRIVVEVIVGLGLGALAAITGLMLGSLRLPMMIRYLRMNPKEAVGTNMAVGCLTALIGATTAYAAGAGKMNWLVIVAVVPPTLIGSYLGGCLTGRFSKEAIMKLAGWIIAASGCIMFVQGSKLYFHKTQPQVPPIIVNKDETDDDYEYYDPQDFQPATPAPEDPLDEPIPEEP